MKNLDDGKVVGSIDGAGGSTSGRRKPVSQRDGEVFRTPDVGIVRGLQDDDPKALQELVDALWSPLAAFAQRILGGAGDPEGTVQTAFARLWSRRRSLDDTGSLRSLLYTMVRNACLDEIRRVRRQERIPAENLRPPPPRTPYEDVQGAELHRLAAAAVARLPERRREVFRLVREEGLSYKEVARVMDLSSQTVANHMSLAMADLRTALRPYLSQESGFHEREHDPHSDLEEMDG